ncbi:hypothetical protein P4O66_011177 [Electrophorus voltai]|uniref:Transposase Tc1-like domain-containing protein n=1 Tax=Electrophorus voltai TaxID=2609070 RepID=A0AAD9DVG3_9TELE|nr:hypothetical protein P4O66_011177 [Electrophorus voltai]
MVQNRLLEAGLKSCKARKKPFINEKQRRARLKFVKDHKDWTIEDWSKVIFSDECNIQLCPTPDHVKQGIKQIFLCEGHMNQATYKTVLEENLLPSALTMFPN